MMMMMMMITIIIIAVIIIILRNEVNTETDSKCRLCQQFDETINHITSACPILAKEQYIKRHDRVCAQLHFNICKETGVQLVLTFIFGIVTSKNVLKLK